MAKGRDARRRGTPHGGARAGRTRWFTVGCGTVTAFAVAALILLQLLPGRRADEHTHPLAPHNGKVVSLGHAGGHYHVEVVVEPAGDVRLYPLGEDTAAALAVETQHLPAEAAPAGSPDTTEFALRPEPGEGGTTTSFVGRLPASAVAGQVFIRVAGLRVRGASHPFELTWDHGRPTAEVVAVYEAEQRRIYLAPGGRYTDADINAAGSTTAAAKYRAYRPVHDLAPKPGDRTCPVTGRKAAAALSWPVAGKRYLFCCQPCIDTFVRLAKERPGEVKEPEHYVR